jgi:hypothetical protein
LLRLLDGVAGVADGQRSEVGGSVKEWLMHVHWHALVVVAHVHHGIVIAGALVARANVDGTIAQCLSWLEIQGLHLGKVEALVQIVIVTVAVATSVVEETPVEVLLNACRLYLSNQCIGGL